MEKIYVVKYHRGRYDDASVITIFATFRKDTARQYVERFNTSLKKWKDYYKQFEGENEFGFQSLKKEHFETKFERWLHIIDTGFSFYNEVELR